MAVVTGSPLASPADIMPAIVTAAQGLGQATLWWRGHSESSWSLRPSVFRGSRGKNAEKSMLTVLRTLAPSRYANCPPRADIAAWLFLAQHYRMATRLLDWTASPLIALYFALRENDDKEAALWALSPFTLNNALNHDGSIYGAESPVIQQMINAIFLPSTKPLPAAAALNAHQIDLRMLVQQSAFTIHDSETPLEDHVDAAKFAMKFPIRPESRASLKGALELFGIRRSTLFPDLENLCAELADTSWLDIAFTDPVPIPVT